MTEDCELILNLQVFRNFSLLVMVVIYHVYGYTNQFEMIWGGQFLDSSAQKEVFENRTPNSTAAAITTASWLQMDTVPV